MASDPRTSPDEESTLQNNPTPLLEQQSSEIVNVRATSPPGSEQAQQQQHDISREKSSSSSSPRLQTVEHPASPSPEVQAKPQNLCQVCLANPPKYKCPRCYLPYCSVACNKIHRENHPPDPEPGPEPKTAQEPLVSQNTTIADAPDPSNPFRALETSEALKRLFQKYPSLPTQLLEIHAATQPPKEAPDKVIPASLMQGITKKDSWNHDIGIKNGKAALRRAKKDTGQAGEAVREYAELIQHIMNEAGQKEVSATYFQQQAAREDTKLIERLMAEEQQRKR